MSRGLRHPVGLSLLAMVALLASVPLYIQVFVDLGFPPLVRLLLFCVGILLAIVVTPAMLVAALILAWWRSR